MVNAQKMTNEAAVAVLDALDDLESAGIDTEELGDAVDAYADLAAHSEPRYTQRIPASVRRINRALEAIKSSLLGGNESVIEAVAVIANAYGVK